MSSDLSLAHFGNGPRWYVLETKPRYEPRVIFHLGRRAAEVETFFPQIEAVRKRAGRRIAVTEPLFPNYLFLRVDLTPETLTAIRWTPGIKQLLGNGEPASIPDELVGRIQERIEPFGFIRLGLRFKRGDRVRVMVGPFAGLEAVFDRPMSRQGRVRVLLQILGALTPLEIDELDLGQA